MLRQYEQLQARQAQIQKEMQAQKKYEPDLLAKIKEITKIAPELLSAERLQIILSAEDDTKKMEVLDRLLDLARKEQKEGIEKAEQVGQKEHSLCTCTKLTPQKLKTFIEKEAPEIKRILLEIFK